MADNKTEKGGVMSKALVGVRDQLAKKYVEFQNAMKTGDTEAARKAIAADNDIKSLDRVIKRVDKGYYA